MTLYRLYLRSRVRRASLATEKTSFEAAAPLLPSTGREECRSMVYGDQHYSYIVRGREDFEAENDAAALAIARSIFEAATDLCEAFELWDGTRQIDQSRVATLPTRTANAQRQEHIIRVEEALLNSSWAIARSRRLLARFNELRDQAKDVDPRSRATPSY